MSDGFRFGGKNFRSEKELDALPEQYRAQWEQGKRPKDPGFNNPELAPNAGRVIVPHVATFSGIVSTLAKTYKNPDEAIRHSTANAAMMRRDPMVMGPLLARQQSVALLDWTIEPEDKRDPEQVEVAKLLHNMIASIPNFVKYRRNLLEAIWYGRYGIQHRWGFTRTSRGTKVIAVNSWVPVNGDKILFRYEDYTGKYDHDEIGIKVSPAHVKNDIIAGRQDLEWNTEGSAVFLRRWERARMALHKHLIMDGDYEDPTTGGMIHGVGIRHFIYWTWFQKQETMAQLAELVDRSGMGFTIYRYPAGDDQAKQEMLDIANKQATANQIVMPHDPMNPAYGIEQIPPNTQGVNALMELIDGYFGGWILRFILGQTSTVRAEPSGLGGGQSDLHRESFVQIVRYDAENLDDTITRDLVQRYVEFNFPSMKHINFKFKSHVPDPNVNEKLAGLQAAWTMGAKIKANDIMSLVGLNLAGEDDVALYNPELQASIMQLEQQGAMPAEPEAAEGAEGAEGEVPEEGVGEGGSLEDLDQILEFANSMNYMLLGEKERYAADEGLMSERAEQPPTSPDANNVNKDKDNLSAEIKAKAGKTPAQRSADDEQKIGKSGLTEEQETARKEAGLSVPKGGLSKLLEKGKKQKEEFEAKQAELEEKTPSEEQSVEEALKGQKKEGDKELQAEPPVPETVGQDLTVKTKEEAAEDLQDVDEQDLGGLEEGKDLGEGERAATTMIGAVIAGALPFDEVTKHDTSENHLKTLTDNVKSFSETIDKRYYNDFMKNRKSYDAWVERKRKESPGDQLEGDISNYERYIEGLDHHFAQAVLDNFDNLFVKRDLEKRAMDEGKDWQQVGQTIEKVKQKFTEQIGKLDAKHGTVKDSLDKERIDRMLSEEKQLQLGEEMFSEPERQTQAQIDIRNLVTQASFNEATGKEPEPPSIKAEDIAKIPVPEGSEGFYENTMDVIDESEKTVRDYVSGDKTQIPEGRASKLWDITKVAAEALTSSDPNTKANAKLLLEQQSAHEIAAVERILGRNLDRFYDKSKIPLYPSQVVSFAVDDMANKKFGEDVYISHVSLMDFIAPKIAKGEEVTDEDWMLAIDDHNENALGEKDKIDTAILGEGSAKTAEGKKIDEELTAKAKAAEDVRVPAGVGEGIKAVEGEEAGDSGDGDSVEDEEMSEDEYNETLDLVQSYVNDPANEYTDEQIEAVNRVKNQEDLQRVIADLGIQFEEDEDIAGEDEDSGEDTTTEPVAEKRKQLRKHKDLDAELESKGIEKPDNWDSLKVAEKNEFLNNLESEGEPEGKVIDEDEDGDDGEGTEPTDTGTADGVMDGDVDVETGVDEGDGEDEGEDETVTPVDEGEDGGEGEIEGEAKAPVDEDVGEDEEEDTGEDEDEDSSVTPAGDDSGKMSIDEFMKRYPQGQSPSRDKDGETIPDLKIPENMVTVTDEDKKRLGIVTNEDGTMSLPQGAFDDPGKIVKPDPTQGAPAEPAEDVAEETVSIEPAADEDVYAKVGENARSLIKKARDVGIELDEQTRKQLVGNSQAAKRLRQQLAAKINEEYPAYKSQIEAASKSISESKPKIDISDMDIDEKSFIQGVEAADGVLAQVLGEGVDVEAAIRQAYAGEKNPTGMAKDLHREAARAGLKAQKMFNALFDSNPKYKGNGTVDLENSRIDGEKLARILERNIQKDPSRVKMFGLPEDSEKFAELVADVRSNPRAAASTALKVIRGTVEDSLKNRGLKEGHKETILKALTGEDGKDLSKPMYNVPIERVSKQLKDQVDFLRGVTPYMKAAGIDDSRVNMAWNALSDVNPDDKVAVRRIQDKADEVFQKVKEHVDGALSSKAGRELGIDPRLPLDEKMKKLEEVVQRSTILTEGLEGFISDEELEELREGGPSSIFSAVEGWQKAAKSEGWNPDPNSSEIENFKSAFTYMNKTLPEKQLNDAMIAVFAGIAIVSGLIILGGLFKWLTGGDKK